MRRARRAGSFGAGPRPAMGLPPVIGHTVPMGWVRRAFAPKNWVPVWLTWPSAFVVGALIGRSQVRDWKARAFHEHLKP